MKEVVVALVALLTGIFIGMSQQNAQHIAQDIKQLRTETQAARIEDNKRLASVETNVNELFDLCIPFVAEDAIAGP